MDHHAQTHVRRSAPPLLARLEIQSWYVSRRNLAVRTGPPHTPTTRGLSRGGGLITSRRAGRSKQFGRVAVTHVQGSPKGGGALHACGVINARLCRRLQPKGVSANRPGWPSQHSCQLAIGGARPVRRLEHHGSSPHDDIKDAEFVEVGDERQAPPPPPTPPTLGAWWLHQGFFVKALITLVPLLLLAMCMAVSSEPIGPTSVESGVGAAQPEASGNLTASDDLAMTEDAAASGPPTCASIEPDVERIFTKNGTAVIEINTTRSEIVDGNPSCYGSVLTEAGTVFVTYGVRETQKGQFFVYVRPTLDLVVPPGLEGARSSNPTASAESERLVVAPAERSADPPPTAPSPSATQPTPTASSSATDADIFAPHA